MTFPWIRRNDLIIQPHDTGGWLIKDPVSLQYTLLSAVEYGLFQKLDGKLDTNSLLKDVPEADYSVADLQAFLSHLIKRQLLFRTTGGDSERLATNGKLRASPLTLLSRLMSWHVPIGNPQPALRHLQWVSSVVRHAIVKRLCFAVFLIAALSLTINFSRVVSAVDDLANHFTAFTAVSMLVIVIVVKAAHELGHALAAQHYGAECHEAGILFLFMTPVPFTNVTDSWKLPVRQRMIVTAAGMLVELLVASICIILWAIAANSTTRDLLLQTAVVCSLNTVLFNGNPLLKFDGYFLLSDFLRIPNLSARSFDLLRSKIATVVLGQIDSRHIAEEKANTLLTYAMFAAVYRVILAFSILELIHVLCTSNDIEALGWLLKVLTLALLFGGPLLRTLLILTTSSLPTMPLSPEQGAMTGSGPDWGKGIFRSLLAATALAFVSFQPLPSRVISVASVSPIDRRIFAEVSGRLSVTSEDNGNTRISDWRIKNSDSQTALVNLRAELELAELRVQIAKRTRRDEPESSLKELLEAVNSAKGRLTEATNVINLQTQPGKSVEKGFIASRRFIDDVDGSFGESWSGQPLAPRNLGAWIEQGTTLGYVQTGNGLQITAWVSQVAIQDIHVGQKATFRLSAGDSISQQAMVESISRFPVQILPENVAVSGEIPGELDASGFRPDGVFFAVTIQLSGSRSGIRLPLDGVGLTSIQVKSSSLADRFYNYLRRTFVLTSES